MSTEIQKFNEEVTRELANKETLATLVATTFKGLEEANVKLACVEGMMRGFKFTDFLQKNIYALPFRDNATGKQHYSLVTSIDYARKIGMRSGVTGKSEPTYAETAEGKIISCSVTIEREVAGRVGKFSSKVFFSEYTTNRNLWTSKPRTMIAKVAEMHALRMACPEEMSQVYVEEELEKTEVAGKIEPIDVDVYSNKLKACKTLDELRVAFSAMPMEAKTKLESLKNELKATLK